ncbi:MAG: glucosamine-6-phosphate deaminase [Proteobacteria bacterium]|nr:MAG: glucosamine-6-phosphate deaminase [Pseudomonadota bacterium]
MPGRGRRNTLGREDDVRIVIESSAEAGAAFAAQWVARQAVRRPECVLALAAGSTMLPVYAAIAAAHAGNGGLFTRCRAFDLDEYVGLAGDDPRSFRHFVRSHFTARVGIADAAHDAPNGLAVDLEAECARYEAAIEAAGGLDVAVLGLGRNGHLAFNEPGVSLAGRTRVEVLMRSEVLEFGEPSPLPRVAITMGVGTILAARRCLVLAFGSHKERAVAEMLEGAVTSMVPASALQLHSDTTVVLDDAAAALLVNAAHYREAEALRREMGW